MQSTPGTHLQNIQQKHADKIHTIYRQYTLAAIHLPEITAILMLTFARCYGGQILVLMDHILTLSTPCPEKKEATLFSTCLLYTSDAADE